MTLQVGDRAVIKPGGRATFRLSGLPVLANNWSQIEPAGELEVRSISSSYEGAEQLAMVVPTGARAGGMVSRHQLLRLFAGGFREGDRVVSTTLNITGDVVDQDPNGTTISRADNVPVRIATTSPTLNGGLFKVGEVVYTDPSYLTRVQTPSTIQAHDIKLTCAEATEDSKPRLEDVTGISTWTNLQVGDIVTAEHKTQASAWSRGGRREIVNSRTSEVVADPGYGVKFWCELELDDHNKYDPYTITKVLRPAKVLELKDRRKPLRMVTTRIVPTDGVWEAGTRRATGKGYVEPDQEGVFWLHFTEGPNAGQKIRLKEGRDSVSYDAIMGTYLVREKFEELVVATHDPE